MRKVTFRPACHLVHSRRARQLIHANNQKGAPLTSQPTAPPTGAQSFRVGSRGKHQLEILLGVTLLAPLAILALTAFHWEMARFPTLLLIFLIGMLGMGAMLYTTTRYRATGRLRVDDNGIELQSEAPRYLAASYQSPWSVRWNEIAQVAVMESLGLVHIRRQGFTALPMALRVADWVPAHTPDTVVGKPQQMRQTELWRALEARGLFSRKPDARMEAMNFDLGKHPATRTALIAMALLAGYWAIDSLLAREAWAEWRLRYILPHVTIGIAGAALGLLALQRAGPPAVPVPVAAPLAMVLGLAAGVASWTGLVRVNQVLGGPLEQARYVRNEACDTLLPVKEDLPPIEYTGLAKGYWCQFPKDKQHVVPVRRGLFGLYQVDLTEHTAAITAYRRGQR